MKSFTVVGSFLACSKYLDLNGSGISLVKMHEIAVSFLHRGLVKDWPGNSGEAVFYLEGREYFALPDFMKAVQALPEGDYIVEVEVFDQSSIIPLERIEKISIINTTIMEDKELKRHIRRLLALDYSGNVGVGQRTANWDFFDRFNFNSRGTVELSPFVCCINNWGLKVEFELEWSLDNSLSLKVVATNDSDPQ